MGDKRLRSECEDGGYFLKGYFLLFPLFHGLRANALLGML